MARASRVVDSSEILLNLVLVITIPPPHLHLYHISVFISPNSTLFPLHRVASLPWHTKLKKNNSQQLKTAKQLREKWLLLWCILEGVQSGHNHCSTKCAVFYIVWSSSTHHTYVYKVWSTTQQTPVYIVWSTTQHTSVYIVWSTTQIFALCCCLQKQDWQKSLLGNQFYCMSCRLWQTDCPKSNSPRNSKRSKPQTNK